MVATPDPYESVVMEIAGKKYTMVELNAMPREEFEALAVQAKHLHAQQSFPSTAGGGDVVADPPSRHETVDKSFDKGEGLSSAGAGMGVVPGMPASASEAAANLRKAEAIMGTRMRLPGAPRPLEDLLGPDGGWRAEKERELFVRFDLTVPFYGRRDAAKKIRAKLERAVELAMGDEAIVIMREVREVDRG